MSTLVFRRCSSEPCGSGHLYFALNLSESIRESPQGLLTAFQSEWEDQQPERELIGVCSEDAYEENPRLLESLRSELILYYIVIAMVVQMESQALTKCHWCEQSGRDREHTWWQQVSV